MAADKLVIAEILLDVLTILQIEYGNVGDGTGRVLIPFLGALGHISIRVVLSWLLFSYLGLNAVALATGIGWICANVFWGVIRIKGNADSGGLYR